ncbi:MAG: hypothetical protein EBY28_06615, partial [Betaproteobacteria bacterium]|nr:hypothetical protein [Betaproteobacteria bacterium]
MPTTGRAWLDDVHQRCESCRDKTDLPRVRPGARATALRRPFHPPCQLSRSKPCLNPSSSSLPPARPSPACWGSSRRSLPGSWARWQ